MRKTGFYLFVLMIGLLSTGWLFAADSAIGTWVEKSVDSQKPKVPMTMIIEPSSGNGRKITYKLTGPDGNEMTMTVDSPMDGTDAPVLMNGKPSAMTMGIKRLDDHHASTVQKLNGKQFSISNATLSDDFNTLTVESEVTSEQPGRPAGNHTEIWVRQ